MKKIFDLPDGIKSKLDGYELTIEGPKGSVKKLFKHAIARLSIDGNKIILESTNESRRGKMLINTLKAHIKNMIKGVKSGYDAKLKICYSHFPITAKVQGNELIVENFCGEKFPRKADIVSGCVVKVQGSDILINGLDKEAVGKTAASIECATKIRNKDQRLFQDGIWITKKPGKEAL